MGYLDVQAGRYQAQAIGMKAGKSSQKQTPYIEVEFLLTELNEKLRYTGYLTEKTEDRTMDVMDTLGWSGDTKFGPGSFDTHKVVELVVSREMGQDGVERPRVQYVNDPAKPRAQGVESDESALAGLNLKAKMAARKAQAKTQQPPANFSVDTEEEFGF